MFMTTTFYEKKFLNIKSNKITFLQSFLLSNMLSISKVTQLHEKSTKDIYIDTSKRIKGVYFGAIFFFHKAHFHEFL